MWNTIKTNIQIPSLKKQKYIHTLEIKNSSPPYLVTYDILPKKKLLFFYTNKMINKMKHHTHAFLFFLGGLFLMLVWPSLIPTTSAAAARAAATPVAAAVQKSVQASVVNDNITTQKFIDMTYYADLSSKSSINFTTRNYLNAVLILYNNLGKELKRFPLLKRKTTTIAINNYFGNKNNVFGYVGNVDSKGSFLNEKFIVFTNNSKAFLDITSDVSTKNILSVDTKWNLFFDLSNETNIGTENIVYWPAAIFAKRIAVKWTIHVTVKSTHAAASDVYSCPRCLLPQFLTFDYKASADILQDVEALDSKATTLQIVERFKNIFAKLFDGFAYNLKWIFVELFKRKAYISELEAKNALAAAKIDVLLDALLKIDAKVWADMTSKMEVLDDGYKSDVLARSVQYDLQYLDMLNALWMSAEAKAYNDTIQKKMVQSAPYKAEYNWQSTQPSFSVEQDKAHPAAYPSSLTNGESTSKK